MEKFMQITSKNNPKFVEPIIIFSDNYVLRYFNSVYKSIYNKEKYLND